MRVLLIGHQWATLTGDTWVYIATTYMLCYTVLCVCICASRVNTYG